MRIPFTLIVLAKMEVLQHEVLVGDEATGVRIASIIWEKQFDNI